MINCATDFVVPLFVCCSQKQAVTPDDGDRSNATEADRAETARGDLLTAIDISPMVDVIRTIGTASPVV